MLRTIKQHASHYRMQLHPAALAALSNTPRKAFQATERDQAEPIGYGQTISQPFMVAAMTHMAFVHSNNTQSVLEIGTGSGYQSAVLSHVFDQVVTTERIGALHRRAKKKLARYPNIFAHHHNGNHPIGHNFSCIVVTCGVHGALPISWQHQLTEQGIIVVPHAPTPKHTMQLKVYTKHHNAMQDTTLAHLPIYCRFVPFVPDDHASSRA